MANADVGAQSLYYERHGSGEPLLMIQGLSGNHLHWGEPFLSRLEPHFETMLYDHRGVGHSGPARDPYSIADLADDAAGLLDALELPSAHVLGCSMGGMVAQELALRHPERVRTLALGCTYAGGAGSTQTDPAIVMRLAELLMTQGIGATMKEGFEFNVSAAYAADPANLETFKRIASELPTALDVMMAQLKAVAGHDTSARLGEIRMPTLIVHGSEDQILPVANAHHLAGLIPHARLEILDGVGHLWWWERPERAAELLIEQAQAAPAR